MKKLLLSIAILGFLNSCSTKEQSHKLNTNFDLKSIEQKFVVFYPNYPDTIKLTSKYILKVSSEEGTNFIYNPEYLNDRRVVYIFMETTAPIKKL
jgi:hypothetical protein